MKNRETRKIRDRVVAIRRLTIASAAALTLAGVAGVESPARACSLQIPGLYDRSVWPGPEHVPTNPRLVVRYRVVRGAAVVPPVGSGLVLQDADGTPIPAAVEIAGDDAVVRPVAPLLPNHTYQLADNLNVPCDTYQNPCVVASEPQVFASFTTGAGADESPPVFGGTRSIEVLEHFICESDACCGPYDVYQVRVGWDSGTDDVAGSDLRYNVYRREGASLAPVAAGVGGTELVGSAVCSGSSGASFEPGVYVVRAVDGAGNEDANTVGRQLGDPCSSSGSGSGCAVAGDRVAPTSPVVLVVAALLLFAAVLTGRLATRPRRHPIRR
jgi:hypothetical protein